MRTMKKEVSHAFEGIVRSHYKKHGRHTLPWRPPTLKLRGIDAPYKILVSEVMLQQTQVDRVIPKYASFIKRFPTFQALGRAKTADVVREWQGLGYNRRALNLKKAAEVVVQKYNGKLPRDFDALVSLPGVGPYTAGALLSFIWNEPISFIETNIRTVFIHHFFQRKKKVSDVEIENKIVETLDVENPREWYWALMDYGAYLKKTLPNPSRKSAHHVPQKPFKDSYRQLRGNILKLVSQKNVSEKTLFTKIKRKPVEIRDALNTLAKEGFIKRRGKNISLA